MTNPSFAVLSLGVGRMHLSVRMTIPLLNYFAPCIRTRSMYQKMSEL